MTKEQPPYHDRIVQDPEIPVGRPVVKGTRIPVEVILTHLAHNPDLHDLFAAYPRLTVADVQAVLSYAAHALAERPSPSPAPVAPAPAPEPAETAGQALLRLASIGGTGPADLSARIDDELYGPAS